MGGYISITKNYELYVNGGCEAGGNNDCNFGIGFTAGGAVDGFTGSTYPYYVPIVRPTRSLGIIVRDRACRAPRSIIRGPHTFRHRPPIPVISWGRAAYALGAADHARGEP